MKKTILLLVIFILAISLVACSTSSSSDQKTGKLPENDEEVTEAVSEDTQAIAPGNYIENGNYRFSFEKAALYDEIVENEYYSEKPEDGKQFLVCFFEVENISSESQYVNYFYFQAYLDDYDIDMKLLMSDVDGYGQLSGDLQPGKKQKGYVCYEVGSDWKKLEMTYTDGAISGDKYNFIVTPDDI